LSNEDLAQWILNRYPQFYDAISPTARKIKEIADRPRVSQKLWEGNRLANEAKMIENDKAEAELLHAADMLIKASGMGIPVVALPEIAVITHKTDEMIRFEKFKTQDGLNGIDRARLGPHHQIELLQDRLMALIDERDKESHPDKREALNIRVQQLKEELRARGQQTVVQAGGDGLRLSDQNSDSAGGSESSTQTDSEPVPPPRNRAGF
jgi:hypothetical protein